MKALIRPASLLLALTPAFVWGQPGTPASAASVPGGAGNLVQPKDPNWLVYGLILIAVIALIAYVLRGKRGPARTEGKR